MAAAQPLWTAAASHLTRKRSRSHSNATQSTSTTNALLCCAHGIAAARIDRHACATQSVVVAAAAPTGRQEVRSPACSWYPALKFFVAEVQTRRAALTGSARAQTGHFGGVSGQRAQHGCREKGHQPQGGAQERPGGVCMRRCRLPLLQRGWPGVCAA